MIVHSYISSYCQGIDYCFYGKTVLTDLWTKLDIIVSFPPNVACSCSFRTGHLATKAQWSEPHFRSRVLTLIFCDEIPINPYPGHTLSLSHTGWQAWPSCLCWNIILQCYWCKFHRRISMKFYFLTKLTTLTSLLGNFSFFLAYFLPWILKSNSGLSVLSSP